MKMVMPLWSTSAYISKWDELQPSDQTDMEEDPPGNGPRAAHLVCGDGRPLLVAMEPPLRSRAF